VLLALQGMAAQTQQERQLAVSLHAHRV